MWLVRAFIQCSLNTLYVISHTNDAIKRNYRKLLIRIKVTITIIDACCVNSLKTVILQVNTHQTQLHLYKPFIYCHSTAMLMTPTTICSRLLLRLCCIALWRFLAEASSHSRILLIYLSSWDKLSEMKCTLSLWPHCLLLQGEGEVVLSSKWCSGQPV